MSRIKTCDNTLKLREIVGRNSSCNVFFTGNYANYISGKVIYAYSSDFVVPVSITSKKIFTYATLLSEPSCYCEGSETLTQFLNELCLYLSSYYKVQWILETPASALFSEVPDKAVAIPFGSHIVDLSNDIDILWSNVHSKHRNVIKKAEKEGVQIVKGNSEKILNDYHSIDVETWERSNVKASGVDHLKEMVTKLGDNIIFYMAYKDGEPQAGAIFFYNQAMSYYMHGASSNHPFTGSSNLLHWVAMQDMKAAGVKRYSFVGARINEDENSKFHGIQRFKERFGGELFIGKRFKVILNPFMYRLFVLLHSVKASFKNRNWKMYRDSIDTELPKWKNKN